ncbi:DUF6529 family protein [Pseudonocardia lacus]|uniref:DUF6529 family protein n=1 Tax=Pseudonocardia lacus TaxID=2835865 RepID=UPI0027E2E748|nr:DUF6529 family protein [Pseudonocardia lacus]
MSTETGADATTALGAGADPTTTFGPGADATTALGAGHAQPGAWTDDPDAATQPIPLVPRPMGEAGPARPAPRGTLLIALALGIGVSVGLGAYSRFHEATGTALNLAGFSSGLAAKAWLASLAFVFALVQLVSALRMYGKLGSGGAVAAALHRWSGRLAVLVTVPVAVHCLYALGFQDFDTRVLVHSAAGCFFYGAFAAKMVLVSRDGAPKWALPVFGGLVFTVLTAIWTTSSVWFFGTSGLVF